MKWQYLLSFLLVNKILNVTLVAKIIKKEMSICKGCSDKNKGVFYDKS